MVSSSSRRLRVTVAFTAAVASSFAFAPSARISASPLRRAESLRPSSTMSMALPIPRKFDIPIPRRLNPFDWSVDRPTRYKVEGQDLYRTIGVAPETDFDEIKEVVKQLCDQAEAAGDRKKKIKLEICQDKIMELRLRQASAGKLQMTGEALYKNNKIQERDEALANRNKKIKAPKWTKGLVQYPTKKYAIQCAKFIAIFAAAGGLILPGLATPMTAFIVFTGMNNIYKRNRPQKFQEEGMPQGPDLPSMGEFGKIIGITMFTCFFGSVLSSLMKGLLVPRLLAEGPFTTDRILCFSLSCSAIFQSCFFNIYPKKDKGKKTF